MIFFLNLWQYPVFESNSPTKSNNICSQADFHLKKTSLASTMPTGPSTCQKPPISVWRRKKKFPIDQLSTCVHKGTKGSRHRPLYNLFLVGKFTLFVTFSTHIMKNSERLRCLLFSIRPCQDPPNQCLKRKIEVLSQISPFYKTNGTRGSHRPPLYYPILNRKFTLFVTSPVSPQMIGTCALTSVFTLLYRMRGSMNSREIR